MHVSSSLTTPVNKQNKRKETAMSMSTHIVGFTPPDDIWRQMKVIWDGCVAAEIPVPKEVGDFFNWTTPDPSGIEYDLTLREWKDDTAQGWELDVESIPGHVKTIRFYNAW